ncbi:CDP-diacylglycerol-serine O-phosphatidyltransferase [Lodderomyces elongisporus]|uniref:CDP-diacylglycerol--serine O-phosphatidyltransferase n=1 Tax=Lodderomyces elongisporus (strain ATCC 11503 / CBS 2605 / JCM 1781 / NBRC 1676 / NRRL YB-4239) TaxID=379508 RepID=A5DTW3_LODEL|nr:CDP-diacylglycerol-serine O-phosphatidyltransferase [Lodderomyces elongisporus]EDK42621.1 CDP-diacylglycerol-serine O-phosphatidyltransferase [Lodderomyces elongisporus NRRL YB-4239]WLF77059.1 CDP-diacylglycerol-serine O-phosphatidyltransferase [Lodderomyces elongisporus]
MSSTGFEKHASDSSAIVSDSDIETIPTHHDTRPYGVSGVNRDGVPTTLRRSSSLFSLSSKEDIPKPEQVEYQKFIDDQRHFSMIRNLHMADFITLLNGFSGFYAIISCLRYTLTNDSKYVQRAHFFIVLGLFFDFFDGRVARLRNKSSLMGQELDSLADLVSFGVSPATIAFAIGFQTTLDVLLLTFWVLCGLTRLARFNISVNNIPKDKSGKSQYFEGLPIPSNLVWVAFMAFLVWKDWIHANLPLGVALKGTPFEFHIVAVGFVLQGCANISKSLKIPKP